MLVAFQTLLKGASRDRISLFWAIAFPLILLVILGYLFPSMEYRQQLLAGVLGFGVVSKAMMGGAFEVMKQRRGGVYKLLRATPFSTLRFLLLLASARGLVTLVTSGVLLLAGSLLFGLSYSLAAALLLMAGLAVTIFTFSLLGFVVGNLGQNETQVSMLNNVLTLPMFFATETFYSLAGAPAWVQVLKQFLPLQYVLEALRAAMDGNAGGMMLPMGILIAFAAGFLLMAVSTFRWDPSAPLRLRVRQI